LIDGLYFPWDKDEQIALKMAEIAEVERYRPDYMILEGGAITVDGEGTVVVTDQSVLCPGRTCSAVLVDEDEDNIWPNYGRKYEPWSEELRAFLSENAELDFGVCEADAVTIYSSELSRRGPKYEPLAEITLGRYNF
ncbi:MAG: agmatine deiminase family protein, partial [Thermoguttaceae bacterium]|nr:agmatine deiminase family protein [Thermoguttaceae bacterium]